MAGTEKCAVFTSNLRLTHALELYANRNYQIGARVHAPEGEGQCSGEGGECPIADETSAGDVNTYRRLSAVTATSKER